MAPFLDITIELQTLRMHLRQANNEGFTWDMLPPEEKIRDESIIKIENQIKLDFCTFRSSKIKLKNPFDFRFFNVLQLSCYFIKKICSKS